MGLVFSIRFMGCMGGPARNLTCNSTIPGRVDSGNTPRRAQCITSWPFAHPCGAAAFFSLHVKCDKKAKKWCAWRSATAPSAIHQTSAAFPHDCSLTYLVLHLLLQAWSPAPFRGSNWCVNVATAGRGRHLIRAREKKTVKKERH